MYHGGTRLPLATTKILQKKKKRTRSKNKTKQPKDWRIKLTELNKVVEIFDKENIHQLHEKQKLGAVKFRMGYRVFSQQQELSY